MKNKYVPALVAAIIGLTAWLFLPYMEGLFRNFSIFDLISEYGTDILENIEFGGLLMLLPIPAGILAVIGCLIQNKVLALVGSAAGAVSIVGHLFMLMEEGADFEALISVLGAGVWFGLVGFVVAAVFAANVKTAE